MQRLTERQRKFVLYYNGNGTQAAIKAGYSKKTANEQASRLLAKVNIKKHIQERSKKKDLPLIASREERQQFWSDCMRRKIRMDYRQKGSELLARANGDFIETVKHTGEVSVLMPKIKIGGKEVEFDVGSS